MLAYAYAEQGRPQSFDNIPIDAQRFSVVSSYRTSLAASVGVNEYRGLSYIYQDASWTVVLSRYSVRRSSVR